MVEPGLRLALSMLGNRRDAEDATQEALTRAWRKLHQLRSGMPVRPWFFAIVTNQCRNIRRTAWFRLTSVVEVVGRPPAPEPDVEHLDLERGLQRLPAAAAKSRIYRA